MFGQREIELDIPIRQAKYKNQCYLGYALFVGARYPELALYTSVLSLIYV